MRPLLSGTAATANPAASAASARIASASAGEGFCTQRISGSLPPAASRSRSVQAICEPDSLAAGKLAQRRVLVAGARQIEGGLPTRAVRCHVRDCQAREAQAAIGGPAHGAVALLARRRDPVAVR